MPSDVVANNDQYAPHIPDAVRRASQRADELAREAGVANVPPANGEDVTPDVNEPRQDEPQFELTPPEQDRQPAPAAAPGPSPADWEQRYNTLQGKYNTELPELRGQIRSLQEILANIQAPRTREQTFETPAPQPRPQVPAVREIPSEDVEAYGQDLITASQRWSTAAVAPIIQEFVRRLLSVEGGNQQLQNYTAQNSVNNALSRAVPDWETVNVDPNFILWLDQMDMFSGRKRKQMIDEAYNAGDASRTIAFFQAYKNEQTMVSPTPGTQPNQTGENPADRLPLADLAVPGRGRSVSSPAPGAPERRIWTAADVSAFYRQKQRGQWNGREAEAARIEQDIINAPAEGRFRQS
jgi:nucleotide-binding universal stress UspA family protein